MRTTILFPLFNGEGQEEGEWQEVNLLLSDEDREGVVFGNPLPYCEGYLLDLLLNQKQEREAHGLLILVTHGEETKPLSPNWEEIMKYGDMWRGLLQCEERMLEYALPSTADWLMEDEGRLERFLGDYLLHLHLTERTTIILRNQEELENHLDNLGDDEGAFLAAVGAERRRAEMERFREETERMFQVLCLIYPVCERCGGDYLTEDKACILPFGSYNTCPHCHRGYQIPLPEGRENCHDCQRPGCHLPTLEDPYNVPLCEECTDRRWMGDTYAADLDRELHNPGACPRCGSYTCNCEE